MLDIIKYLSENLYAMIVFGVIIALIIFFIVGSIKEKEALRKCREKQAENEIKAPKSSKIFRQGEVIERQEFVNLKEENNIMKNAIILSAGLGKRMNTELPKGAVELLGQPMILYPIKVLSQQRFDKIVVVVGHKKEIIYDLLKGYNVDFCTQEVLNGTAKAVESAKDILLDYSGDTLIIPVDMPLISNRLIETLYKFHYDNNNDLTVLSSLIDNPYSYGRIVRDSYNNFKKITEEVDCTEDEKLIKEINSGVYLVKNELLFKALSKVTNHNKKNEYYLTDIIEIMLNDGYKVEACTYDDNFETMGINDKDTLELVEKIYKERNEI